MKGGERVFPKEDGRFITSSDAAGVIRTPGSELRPGKMTVMRTNFSHLLFVALDTPKGTNVVSIDKALLLLLGLGQRETRGKGPKNEFPCDIHFLLNGDISTPTYSIF